MVPLPGWPTGTRSDVRVTTPTERQVVSVFDGGDAGWGHHQSNYIDYITGHTDPAVATFTAALADAGYARPGHVFAVDVSVPERHGSGSW